MFLERKPDFDWHPGMLLDGTTLQTPFMADLVTLADPTSPVLLPQLPEGIRPAVLVLHPGELLSRCGSEYNDYCRWAAARLPNIRFGQTVSRVEYDEAEDIYLVHAEPADARPVTYRARRLVLGTGTPPYVPAACREPGGDAGAQLAATWSTAGAASSATHHPGRQRPERRRDLLRPAAARSTSTATG